MNSIFLIFFMRATDIYVFICYKLLRCQAPLSQAVQSLNRAYVNLISTTLHPALRRRLCLPYSLLSPGPTSPKFCPFPTTAVESTFCRLNQTFLIKTITVGRSQYKTKPKETYKRAVPSSRLSREAGRVPCGSLHFTFF